MLAPVGVSRKKDAVIPIRKQTTERTAEQAITDLKLLHTHIAESAGKMIRLEMSRAPIMRIHRTTVIAVRTARSILYSFVFVPVALVKVSSKVTAKMRG